ncbi:GIP [Symbiodinium sp. CCMP2592]|nr:GIP [Symbiodinium sp. CCMP2592]
MMNGVGPPLRGGHDMDGEVVAATQRAATTTSPPMMEGAQEAAAGIPAAAPDLGLGGPVRGAQSQSLPTRLPSTLEGSGRPQTAVAAGQQTGQQTGMLTGMLRAVQTLPATVEGMMTRSTAGRFSPGQHDSVEYASVRSMVEEVPPAPPLEPELQLPLFDVPTLMRMQQMQETAPLLYAGSSRDSAGLRVADGMDPTLSMGQEAPRPPSTASSELQAALSMENHGLRMRAEYDAQAYPPPPPPPLIDLLMNGAPSEAPVPIPPPPRKPCAAFPDGVTTPTLEGAGTGAVPATAEAPLSVGNQDLVLWTKTVEEAQEWYTKYLKMDPLSRLTAKPRPSEELAQPKWSRVARRIETMIITASPQAIKDELSASRTSGLLPLLCRLFVIYGPGSLTERELGLKHITDPPVGSTVQEAVDLLRKWGRWCRRMTELGGVLPDSSLQVRALSKICRNVLSQYPEVKVCQAPVFRGYEESKDNRDVQGSKESSLEGIRAQIQEMRQKADEFEARICKEGKSDSDKGVALLDSGATHAVIPYHTRLQNLEKVPVTLAGDEKQEWLRTQGGTLVVPPVHWSRRKGLRVIHPTLGVLNTRISDNTCPYVAEDQALKLISELEDQRLERFKQRIQNLECHLESYDAPPDPTGSLGRFATTGTRFDALRAFLSQPYLAGLPEEIKVALAEEVPTSHPGSDRSLLKLLPLKRAARRSLLDSTKWVVHLCSGPARAQDPLNAWALQGGFTYLQVDLMQPGGKGWDLSKQDGVWKVLLWAASQGRVAAVFSSPPSARADEAQLFTVQAMLLWSLASVTRGCGVPYVAEHQGILAEVSSRFMKWSGTKCVTLSQGSLGGEYLRPTSLITNLDIGYLSTLDPKGNPATPPRGREWTYGLRVELAKALVGNPSGPSCEELDRVIAERGGLIPPSIDPRTVPPEDLPGPVPSTAQEPPRVPDEELEAMLRAFEAESVINSDDEEAPDLREAELDPPLVHSGEVNEGDPDSPEPPHEASDSVPSMPKLTSAETEGWKRHLRNGHLPYRRDCRQCVEGSGLGPFHRRIKFPRSFALSVDLFGPVPLKEVGRDEGCVTGKPVLRYGLVGAFRVPSCLVNAPSGKNGVSDLFSKPPIPPQDSELADYEPSEEEPELFPELFGSQREPPNHSPVPVDSPEVKHSEAVPSGHEPSLLDEEDLPSDPQALTKLISELREPTDQVVLRYFIPLKTKTGVEVSEALQKMILEINQRFPIRSLHHDPGTEFGSAALSRWLAQHAIRVQHSLPTDKKGNGLSERTVGWVKSRIRTLLNAAALPVGWWPLAARWAVAKHNLMILGEPELPAFGQRVLHRIKRPADGAKQLMDRWVEARYGAPHRSIPTGHVLITDAGNLVASRGFKSEVIDPTQLKDLELPILQEEDSAEPPLSEAVDEAGRPLRRLREKTSVRFLECLDFPTSEELAHGFLIHQDCSLDAVRRVLNAIAQEEDSTGDRRGIVQGRQILGAYCHGGIRGVTTLTRRKPWTTRFLNRALSLRLCLSSNEGKPTWSALMLMTASDVDVHRDWRNEWGTMNYAMHVPGEVHLWVEPTTTEGAKGAVLPTPTWAPGETRVLTEIPVSFNPRKHHAVRMSPTWLLVGYTPLGTSKLDQGELVYLDSCEFPLELLSTEPGAKVVRISDSEEPPAGSEEEQEVSEIQVQSSVAYQVKVVSTSSEDTSESSISSAELSRQIAEAESCMLSSDLQQDTNSTMIGWDFSAGNPGDVPHEYLEGLELDAYLRARDASQAYRQLKALGIEEPNDLQFLFVEDLVEHGIPEWLSNRIMIDIHPPGTRRPDNPQNSSLTTGEVRVFDKAQRQIPWIFQNRTLGVRCPGPPLPNLGIRQPDALQRGRGNSHVAESSRRWDVPSEVSSEDPTDSTPSQPRSGNLSFPDPVPEGTTACTGGSCYNHVMYMQEMWGDDEWVPSAGAASSSSQVPTGSHVDQKPEERTLSEVVCPAEHAPSEESSEDPTDSTPSQSLDVYRCMTVHLAGPLSDVDSSVEQSGEAPESEHRVTTSPPVTIDVPTTDPLLSLGRRGRTVQPEPSVRRVDEGGFTLNVEDLLSSLKGPLEVTHNVSPAEVRLNLAKWRPAAKAELDTFEKMSVIRRFYGDEARAILRDPKYEVIPGKPVCTVKPGEPYKRKFRIVSCGNFAKTTAESQLYAGGAGAESLRALLVHSARRGRRAFGLDVKSAFLLASIPEGVTKRYAMRPPRLLIELELAREDEVWIIDRALYGFRESPRWWSLFRDDFLAKAKWSTELGEVTLEQFSSEGNVWRMRHESGYCIGHLLVYVDDMLLLTEPEVAQSFIGWLRQSWECTGLKEATSSDPLRFLGVDIYAELNDTGDLIGYSLAQESYIAELLRNHEVKPSSRATAPVPKEWVREVPPEEQFSEGELRASQRITGELLWVAQRSRVDISYCVGLMASWVARFPRQVLKIGTRVLEYLANTRSNRLMLIPGKADGLRIFTDASFAPHGSHSITGIALMYDECCVVWKSKRQSIVTLSTAESELVSGCEGVVLGQSLEALIVELEEGPCCKHLMIDNTAAVTLAGGEGSQRTRHLRVRSAFIRDMIDRNEIDVSHCPGDVQLADCLTKALMKSRLDDLCKLLGLGPPRIPPEASVAAVSLPPPLHQVKTREDKPSQQPTACFGSQGSTDRDRLGLWLFALMLLLQIEQTQSVQEDDSEGEPLGLELPLLVLLMILSVLFVWESARYGLRVCCSRQDDEPEVRMLSADDSSVPRARRGSREEVVRRAIARELQGEGLRHRSAQGSEAEAYQTLQVGSSYLRVQVEAQPSAVITGPSPPPPPLPPSGSVPIPAPPTDGLQTAQSANDLAFLPGPPTDGFRPSPPGNPVSTPVTQPDGLREFCGLPVSTEAASSWQPRPRSFLPSSGSERTEQVKKDASTQTTFDRGFNFEELCELHMITTSSRTPGALHLFRSCQALRNSTGVQDRMLCRYCLQALRDGRT